MSDIEAVSSSAADDRAVDRAQDGSPAETLTHRDPRQRPAAELVRDLSTQASTLVRHEMELAKVELTAKGKEASKGAGMFGGAGMLAFYGVGALIAAAIIGLATAVAAWLAAIIVGAALFAVAGILALMGKRHTQRAVPPAPEQTLASVKEDVRFTKEHVQEARHHEEPAR